MSIINPEVLMDIKAKRDLAVQRTYEGGYHILLRALDKAIGVLDQVDYITQKANVEVRIDSNPSS